MAGLRLREVRPVLTMFALVMLVISPHGALATSTSKSDCGRGWRISPSPSPSSSILYGVASFPQGTAWAVGDIHPVFRSSTLALHNDGSGWTQVPTQNPGLESNRLYAVDGASDDDVWAVGTSGDGTLIEHWDGTAWTVAPGPSVPNAFTLLSGVSAASAADTWAVGSSQDASSGVTSTVIEHWDGKSWTITPSPNPGETISELFGVSARSADDAWAVGSFDDATGTFHNLVLHWNGTAWSATSAPSPGLKDNTLFSAVSLGRDDAWAVGYAADGTQESAKSPVTLHWDGSVWNLVPSPELSAQLNGVAATPDGQLWAAGYHEVPATTLIERWDGSAWRVIRSQNHQGGVPNYLVGIALGQRAEFAWAVGSGLSTQGQWRTLTEKPCAAS